MKAKRLGLLLASVSLAASCGTTVISGDSSGSGSGGASTSTGSSSSTASSTSTSTSTGTGTSSSTSASSTGGGLPPCTAADQAMRWAWMDQGPVVPQHAAARLALMGVTLPAAQQVLCPGTNLGDKLGNGTLVQAWGDNQEVWLDYAPATGKGLLMTLWPGYAGGVVFDGAGGADHYAIGLGTPILKNGQPYALDWSSPTLLAAEVDELFRGLVATFTNQAPDPPGTLCTTNAKCATGQFGDAGFVSFEALGLSVWVESVTAPPPAPITPNRFDVLLQ